MKWQKSSYSTQQGNCVEVAFAGDGMAVRDSKDPQGPALRFTADAWDAFVSAVKSGRI